MKPISNWENVEEYKEFKKVEPGGYVIEIISVKHDEMSEWLNLEYDIVEGEFKDYYTERFKKWNYLRPTFYRSYKESCLRMFKGFVTAVEKSNANYIWYWDENTLVGKKVGIILQEEDYVPSMGPHAGEVRTRLIVGKVVEADVIRKGEYKVPEKRISKEAKELNERVNLSQTNSLDIADDDMPF